MDQIDRLRDARGDEQVTFSDVAEHVYDFAPREPGVASVIERLAAFLASVERVPHVHRDGSPGSSVAQTGAQG